MTSLALVLGSLSCHRQDSPTAGAADPAAWTPRPAPDMGAEVARVGGQPIFAAEVSAQSEHFGLSPRAALDQLIEFQLLATRAQARGFADGALARAPAVQRAMVDRLLGQEFEPTVAKDKIPDAELRQMYAKLEHAFVHDRLVEVALLSVYTGPLMKPEPREQARKTAEELADYVAKRSVLIRTPDDFEEIGRDRAWTERRVSYRRLLQGPTRRNGPFGEVVGGALQKLHKPGDTTPLIVDESGYHIARYIGEQPPRNLSFEQARGELMTNIYPLWKRQRFIDWTKILGANHKIEIFADRLFLQAQP
jgi:hypothetical protein